MQTNFCVTNISPVGVTVGLVWTKNEFEPGFHGRYDPKEYPGESLYGEARVLNKDKKT